MDKTNLHQKHRYCRLWPFPGLIFIFFLSVSGAVAGKGNPAQLPPPDRAPLSVRLPQKTSLEKLKSDRAYQYGTEPPPASDFPDRLLHSLLKPLLRLFRAAGGPTGKYIMAALAAGAVLYFLFRILSSHKQGRNARISPAESYAAGQENIHHSDLEALLEEAVSRRDYKTGIRVLYLQALKLLSDRGLIRWHPERTNQSYLLDLAGTSLYEDFKRMTYFFEYVWYGDFKAGEAEFEGMKNRVVRLSGQTGPGA